MKFDLKLITWLCLLCCFTMTSWAQEVITTSGGDGNTSNSNVNWTIGEIVTETAIGTNNILTQGFNQGDLLITKNFKEELPGTNFNVYPNPASDHIKLVTNDTNYENIRFILYDISGRPLRENTITGIETYIPVGILKPSTYFLKVFQNKTVVTIFKIIKK